MATSSVVTANDLQRHFFKLVINIPASVTKLILRSIILLQ